MIQVSDQYMCIYPFSYYRKPAHTLEYVNIENINYVIVVEVLHTPNPLSYRNGVV